VPTWIWESEGSGEIQYEGMVSDLCRCSPNSSGIIAENLEQLSWQKEIAKRYLIKGYE